MDHFQYRNDAKTAEGESLFAESVALSEIAARYGTPAYVYSRATLEHHYRIFSAAFAELPHLICYAVKANSNLAVLQVLAEQGCGFDIVSVGELERVVRAGGDPAKVVFSGVGKRKDEMARALELGIRCFNVESEPELQRLAEVAKTHGVQAPVSLRVNPDVDAKTHPYISTGLKDNKFGIDIQRAESVYQRASELASLDVVGVDCHIGSQLTDTAPFVDASRLVLELIDRLRQQGIALKHLDIGGGLGIRYKDETPPSPAEYAAALMPLLRESGLEIMLEPGRAMVGNAGVLLTTVEFLKPTEHKNFAVVDAAMNDLLRPALYQGWHEVVPVQPHTAAAKNWDIVGPVCETGDFLAQDRNLSLAAGDVLALRSAGAYGMVMASNYNSRPRPIELMVDGDAVHVVRERESLADIMRGEQLING